MRRWGFFQVCGECHEPTQRFELRDYWGCSLGLEPHRFFDAPSEARSAWAEFLDLLRSTPPGDRPENDYWTRFPFKKHRAEREYLEANVVLLEVEFVGYGADLAIPSSFLRSGTGPEDPPGEGWSA